MDKAEEIALEEKWQKADFKNNNVFTWVVSENEDICLELLQMILPELNISEIKEIQKEDSIKNSDIFRGVRFDVFVTDVTGRMYDIEMQIANYHDLSKRMSYYQSNLVGRSLKAGQSFVEKVDTYVIFICDFDFGGAGLAKYTTNLVLAETGKVLDTGEHNIILNVKAKDFSTVSKSLKSFLEFVNNGIVTDTFTGRIEAGIVELKKNTGKRSHFMDYEQHIATERYYARQEARTAMIEQTIKSLVEKGYSKEKIVADIANFNCLEPSEVEKVYDGLFLK